MGRALPPWFDVLPYPVTENSQNTFVIDAIKKSQTIFGFKPMLVFGACGKPHFAGPKVNTSIPMTYEKVRAGQRVRCRERWRGTM
jgi:hypothetical protein